MNDKKLTNYFFYFLIKLFFLFGNKNFNFFEILPQYFILKNKQTILKNFRENESFEWIHFFCLFFILLISNSFFLISKKIFINLFLEILNWKIIKNKKIENQKNNSNNEMDPIVLFILLFLEKYHEVNKSEISGENQTKKMKENEQKATSIEEKIEEKNVKENEHKENATREEKNGQENKEKEENNFRFLKRRLDYSDIDFIEILSVLVFKEEINENVFIRLAKIYYGPLNDGRLKISKLEKYKDAVIKKLDF